MKKIIGFTLVELLTAIAVMMLLLMIGMPAWHHLTLSNRATAALNQVVGLINLARSEAMSRGVTVSLCQSATKKSCDGNWQNGQIIFLTKSEGVLEILHVGNEINGGKIRWQGFGEVAMLQMMPTGFTAEQNGSFIFCPNNGDVRYARAIFISKTGRIRHSEDKDQDGIHEDADGKPLTC